MSERESKWWCGGCGQERDASESSCPHCGGTVLTSLPLQETSGNSPSSATTVRVIRGAV